MNDLMQTRGVASPAPVAPAAEGGKKGIAADTARFRGLIESLEKLAKEQRSAPPVEGAEDVPAAMARADAGFTLAMDLRKQLEDAFRKRGL